MIVRISKNLIPYLLKGTQGVGCVTSMFLFFLGMFFEFYLKIGHKFIRIVGIVNFNG
jgi:hypothetical protein